MTLITPPRTGEEVTLLVSPQARLRGHVTGRSDDAITVELEQTPIRQPFRFPLGSEIDIEWLHALGVMRHSALIAAERDDPHPTLVLELCGEAEPVDRREHDRVAAELPVSAWSLSQPTTRLVGYTIDIGNGGALLWLPDLAPLALSLELRIALPDKPLSVTAGIRWRRDPALVGVEFERVSPAGQARLVDFMRSPRAHTPVAAGV